MIYVFDSSAFIHLFRYYYPDRFPSLWESFDALVSERRIISVREAGNELKDHGDSLSSWAKAHPEVFVIPTADELRFVEEMFRIPRFQLLIGKQKQLTGKPVADPFVIAKAQAVATGCVVAQEVATPNGAKIPNICQHYGVPCLDFEAFMRNEKWRF